MFLCSPGGSDGKESACNARDLAFVFGLASSPGEGNDYPLLEALGLQGDQTSHCSRKTTLNIRWKD